MIHNIHYPELFKINSRADDNSIFRVHILDAGDVPGESSDLSFIVQVDDCLVLVEPPANLPERLAEYRESWKSIEGKRPKGLSMDEISIENLDVLVATSADEHNVQGVGIIASYQSSVRPAELQKARKRPTLFCTEEVMIELRNNLSSKMKVDSNYVNQAVKFVPANEKGSPCIGAVRIDVYSVPNCIERFALRIRYGNRSVAYCGNTHLRGGLRDFLAESDVLLQEAVNSSTSDKTCIEEVVQWHNEVKYAGRLFACNYKDAKLLEPSGLNPLKSNSYIDV